MAQAQTGKNVYDDVWINIQLDEDDLTQAIFTIRMLKDTWVGLSLGATGMAAGTDMIQIDGD